MIDPRAVAELMRKKNKDKLQELLLYHVLPGVILEADFEDGLVETLSRYDVVVTTNPLQFNSANVTDTDILGCNGVLHAIDEVLVPGSKYSQCGRSVMKS